jgi:hypothetical protein
VRTRRTTKKISFGWALTNCRALSRQALLAKPWKMAAHVRHASEAEWFNRLAANVLDCFVDRICRENQV